MILFSCAFVASGALIFINILLKFVKKTCLLSSNVIVIFLGQMFSFADSV